MKSLEKLTKKELIELIRRMETNYANNPQNQARHIYTTNDIVDEVKKEFWETYGIDHDK